MEGIDADGGPVDSDSVDVAIQDRHDLLTIASPTSGDDLRGELDDFTAYVDLKYPIDNIFLRYPDDTLAITVGLFYLYHDYTDQCIWAARFDTLPAGQTFLLSVTDTVPMTKTVDPHT